MLSIAKLVGADYLEQAARGLEEYQLGACEVPGVWLGSMPREPSFRVGAMQVAQRPLPPSG
jgi:hypothetical protein